MMVKLLRFLYQLSAQSINNFIQTVPKMCFKSDSFGSQSIIDNQRVAKNAKPHFLGTRMNYELVDAAL